MSRIGKKAIALPPGVEVAIKEDWIQVTGPQGVLQERSHPAIRVDLSDNTLSFTKVRDEKGDAAAYGLLRSLVANMVKGVTEGFQKILEIVGVGYRAQREENTLVLSLGYSKPVRYAIPDGIEVGVEQKNQLQIKGIDKRLVGLVAAEIRGLRPPEPYKGKGIKYLDEKIRRKVGKTGA